MYSKNHVNLFILLLISVSLAMGQPSAKHNLKFDKLATTWDEGMPLGNGMIGALVWQKADRLRMSLDRADLWDLRPMANIDKPEWSYKWVQEQWKSDTYKNVQDKFDAPYDNNPAPSKIPAAALEFDIKPLGDVVSVELKLANALCEIYWKNGAKLQTFVHAQKPVGWFKFMGVDGQFLPKIIPPAYNLEGTPEATNPVTGADLRRLGYEKGQISEQSQSITYTQKGWGGFEYQVNVRWKYSANVLEGCWSISSKFKGWPTQTPAQMITQTAQKEGFDAQQMGHNDWWSKFWGLSNVAVPDEVLQRQWYLETYKLGAATGNGAPPISLQAVWTADNGKLPPWKGDFHNDLNTQLSYWPTYSGNRLAQAEGFIDWLEKTKPASKHYTKQYFGVNGLNAPGVATLTGEPMGGWIQYAFGMSVSAWLGHHYYLQWRYSMDRDFLAKKAYPWLSDVAVYLSEIMIKDEAGHLKFPTSSSPEIFGNSRKAWFSTMTNFDLALARFTFEKAAELANELGKKNEANKWQSLLAQCPDFDIDPATGFTFAKGFLYQESHRHFSHLLAYHPLGVVDKSKGQKDQLIIDNTLKNLDKFGGDHYCGYSYSWLGNLKARAFDGVGAANALRIFAQHFCLKNSFHANGDQSKAGYSKFTYRPFTLEGNFAFAAGLQEMLIQSHSGVVQIFPAIPADWKNVSFDKLRAEGAFVISAKIENGEPKQITIVAEKGGELRVRNPYGNKNISANVPFKTEGDILVFSTRKGQVIRF